MADQTEKFAAIKKLNLGCGAYKKPGFLNIDHNSQWQPEVVWNLAQIPYPFPDNRFALIEADHVLEHLEDVFRVMRELHRILEPGGRLHIRVPHFSRGFTHVDHKRGFDASFPYYFRPSFQPGYAGVAFGLEAMRLRWFAQPALKKTVLPLPSYLLGRALGGVIDGLANLSPVICSRMWCFLVGGFEELEFHFVCNK